MDKLTEYREEDINVCCPWLRVVECSDTEEHMHLICGFSKAILANDTIKELCLENFLECINISDE